MIERLFRQIAAEEGWTEGAQVAVLLRYAGRVGSCAALHIFLAEERGRSTAPDERFLHDVIAVLRDPGLALDPAFRRHCANSRDLLTPRQAAERWCCWRAA